MTTAYDRNFFAAQSSGSLASARAILPEFFLLVRPTSLIDIGCGVGPWLRAAQDLGVPSVLGLDGTYVDRSQLVVDHDQFEVCDLEHDDLGTAVSDRAPFDVALCMEVAEHLSEPRAATFIAQLCKLSDVIVFSAATPGQGGTNHINEQWPAYWAALFAAHDFECFDVLRSKLWNHADCDWWYLQNILLFTRRHSDLYKTLLLDSTPTAAPLPLIHPRCLEQKQSEFRAHASELSQLLTYQPFGRDEAIRLLESRLHEMRALAQKLSIQVEDLQAQALNTQSAYEKTLSNLRIILEQKETLLHAICHSTSWRITRPLRALKQFWLKPNA